MLSCLQAPAVTLVQLLHACSAGQHLIERQGVHTAMLSLSAKHAAVLHFLLWGLISDGATGWPVLGVSGPQGCVCALLPVL